MSETPEEIVTLPDGVQSPPEPIPGRPGMFVRDMSGEERDRWETSISAMTDATPKSQFYAALVLCAVCHADGRRMFRTDSPAALARTLNAKVLKELYDFAYKVNALGPAGLEDEKKDSGEVSTPASGSSSPSNTESPSPS